MTSSQGRQMTLIFGIDKHSGMAAILAYDLDHPYNFHSAIVRKLHMKFNWNLPSRLEKMSFEVSKNLQSKWPLAKAVKWPWSLVLTNIHIVPTLKS